MLKDFDMLIYDTETDVIDITKSIAKKAAQIRAEYKNFKAMEHRSSASKHDSMPYYLYCRKNRIIPFIDLNEKRGIQVKYKDGIPVCKAGLKMNHDGSEPSKARLKFRCPLASRKYGCSRENPCSDSKYGRTVHLAMKDNPRLINFPPRDSEEWKKEFNARTSAERSNKREKIDFKLESGRHRSTKMWYCRLYHIMMLQHLDAWDMPYESALRKLIQQTA